MTKRGIQWSYSQNKPQNLVKFGENDGRVSILLECGKFKMRSKEVWEQYRRVKVEVKLSWMDGCRLLGGPSFIPVKKDWSSSRGRGEGGYIGCNANNHWKKPKPNSNQLAKSISKRVLMFIRILAQFGLFFDYMAIAFDDMAMTTWIKWTLYELTLMG